MKKITMVLLALIIGSVALSPAPVAAWRDPICDDPLATPDQLELANCNLTEDDTVLAKVPGVVTAVFSIVGLVAVGVIIFGGVRYSVSQGDPGKVKRAKDTIMYAVIGLIVTLSAFAIVAFVLGGIS